MLTQFGPYGPSIVDNLGQRVTAFGGDRFMVLRLIWAHLTESAGIRRTTRAGAIRPGIVIADNGSREVPVIRSAASRSLHNSGDDNVVNVSVTSLLPFADVNWIATRRADSV